jgi:transmembrane serine protease 2
MVISLLKLSLFVVCIFLNYYPVQATVYSCNTTAPCGCSPNDVNINSRIVGGETAASHSWGWAVSLRITYNQHFCGGAILSPYYILTAAHCVEDSSMPYTDLKVAVGTDTLYDDVGQRVSVSKIIIHPRWNSITKENDIAILKLKKVISFKDRNIAKICLPSVNSSTETSFPMTSSSLVAIGWGYATTSGSASNSLRQVTLESVRNEASKCSASINNVKLQFCAAVDGGGKGN